jgi:hypothetical protein
VVSEVKRQKRWAGGILFDMIDVPATRNCWFVKASKDCFMKIKSTGRGGLAGPVAGVLQKQSWLLAI